MCIRDRVCSCQDEFAEAPNIPQGQIPQISVEANIFGQISDANGVALEGAEISVGGETQFSNVNGFFGFNSITSMRYGEVITINQEGYFPAIRRINPINGSDNFVEFQLLSNQPVHSYSSTESSVLEMADGTSLTFPADAISDVNGSDFIGNVNVAFQCIDPTSENILNVLPGSLEGVNEEGEINTLKSYGMVSVELTDDSGSCLLYTSPSPRDATLSRMPSSA